MKKGIEKHSSDPVFIEVPKPVNHMTTAEKDAFVKEMLDALLGKESKNGGDSD